MGGTTSGAGGTYLFGATHRIVLCNSRQTSYFVFVCFLSLHLSAVALLPHGSLRVLFLALHVARVSLEPTTIPCLPPDSSRASPRGATDAPSHTARPKGGTSARAEGRSRNRSNRRPGYPPASDRRGRLEVQAARQGENPKPISAQHLGDEIQSRAASSRPYAARYHPYHRTPG